MPGPQTCPCKEGESQPPDAGRGQVNAHRQVFRDADLVAGQIKDKIQQEQQSITQIPHRPAVRRDPVALVFAGDIRQVRVIKDDRGAKRQVGYNEQHSAQPPQGCGDKEHQGGGNRADGGK